MLRVTPVACMITSAARIESGMLTAATIVERMLARNRKIVSTANTAPRPPSRSRPSRDSLMNDERSDTTLTLTTSLCWPPSSSSFAVTSSATWTVLASEVLETVSESAGWPFVRAKPVVATPASSTVPRSPMVTGVGRGGTAGCTGAGEAFGSSGTVGGTVGVTVGVFTPTTRFSTAFTDSIRPIVETGIFEPSVVISPDGNVRLFAESTPVTWPSVTPFSASLAGSSVIRSRCSSPPVMSTLPTPSIASRAGLMSSCATRAASASPSWEVAASDAMMTGDELMLSAVTCGVTVDGRPAVWRFCSIAARISLTSEPNANWATTSDNELADVDWSASSRGTPEIACSMGFVTWFATSAAPAPGRGAMTVMTGNSMSGSSSCLRLPQARMPARKTAPASRSVTLRLWTANSERRLMQDPFEWRLRRPGPIPERRCGWWRRSGRRRGRGRRGHPGRARAPRRRGARGAPSSGGR